MAPDTSTSVPPPMKWAEDPNRVYLTVDVECKGTDYKFTKDSFSFKGTGVADNKPYEVTLNFMEEINPDDVVAKNNARCVEFTISKAEKGNFWKNLTKDKKKPHFLKIDFNKWRDEDSDQEEEYPDMFDKNNVMQQLGLNANYGDTGDNKPGFDDEESDDSDDDYPNLLSEDGKE